MSTKTKYKVNYIKWWDAESYKDGVSFTGWVKTENKASVKGYTVVIFNQETSDIPETNSCIFIEKEISGSDLAKLGSTRKINAYRKKAEKAMFEEAQRYQETLERTGFWFDKYTLNGFSKTKI